MSVTFSVERSHESVEAPVCPSCGAQSGVKIGNPECTYGVEADGYGCMGYGPSLPGAFDGLNVSNVNAGVILFDLLGYGRDEQDYSGGSLDPADVIRRLATAEARVSECARPVSVEQGVHIDENGVGPGVKVIDCGLPVERIVAYIHNLGNLAREATIAGARIVYG